MRNLLLLFLIFSAIFSFSQQFDYKYYSVVPIRIKAPTTFNLGSISYKITDVVDLQNNNSMIGDVYQGALNHRMQLIAKKGLPRNFNKFFKKAFKYTKLGDRKIVVAFKKLSVIEKKENLGIHGGRLRNYEIEVEYYESLDSNLIYLYTDYQKLDSLSRALEYNMNKFSLQFFKTSLAQLDNYLNENRNLKNKSTIVDSLSAHNIEGKEIRIDTLSNKLKANYQKEQYTYPPKGHYVYSFQQLYGTSSSGFKQEFLGYIRAWDYFECISVLAVEIGYLNLNKKRIDDSRIASVDYIYFSFGAGTLKPLNNFFLAELSAKIAIGGESFYRHPNKKLNNGNTMLGLQLQQKLHFMLGRGFGLTLNIGTYENFSPFTEYMKTDFGISFGVGLKI